VAKRENRELEERHRAEAKEREARRIDAERRRLLEKKRAELLDQLVCAQAEADRINRPLRCWESSPERPAHVEALLGGACDRRRRVLERLSPAVLE